MPIDQVRSHEENQVGSQTTEVKTWQFRLPLEDGGEFNGLNRLGGQVFVDTSSQDNIVVSDSNLTIRLLSVENMNFRTGPGMRMLTDQHDADFGFKWHSSFDYAFVQPFKLSGVVDLGRLGDTGVFHGRVTFGVTRPGWELFGGYDFQGIGDVATQGPLMGVRAKF